MSDYANKLAALADKKQKLIEQERSLVEKRKQEIGDLAERYGLLTASDAMVTGIFSEAADAVKKNDKRLNELEAIGDKILKAKKPNVAASDKRAGDAG
jgi:hypothetical protein